MTKVTKRPLPAKRKLPLKTIIGSLLILAALVILTVIFWDPILSLLSNTERVRDFVDEAGVWGALVFIGIQFLQVLIAPIPGQVVGVAAGASFGTWLGTLYALIGSLLGMWTVFVIARRLGRPFVERFIKPDLLDKFDYLTKNRGAVVFFFIILFPVFPDDIICYLVGLSKIPIRTLLIAGMLGRIPGTIGSALIGDGVAGDSIQLAVGVVIVMVLALAIGYWQRLRIEAWARRLASSSIKRDNK